MNDFCEMTSCEFDNMYENREICLFGAGEYGANWSEIFRESGIERLIFVDNNLGGKNMNVNGYPVYSFEQVYDNRKDYLYIITAIRGAKDIKKQLLENGIDNNRIISAEKIYKSKWLDQLIHRKLINKISYKNMIRKQRDGKCIRIIYDCQAFMIQKRGGVSRLFYEISDGIASYEDAEVTVLDGYNISEYEISKHINRPFSSKMDNALLRDSSIRKRANMILSKTYCAQEGRYDIYHPTYYDDYGITEYRCKIVTVYDMIHEKFSLDYVTIDNKKRMIESADGIIAISESTKKDIIEILGIDEKKIKVIYLGNSLEYGNDKEEALIKEPYILYIGNRKGYKNFDCLLKAFARSSYNRDVKLVCFGGGDFDKEERIKIEECMIKDCIIQIYGDDRKLANLYKHAEMLIYPSMYEGFGLPLVEAMHFGTPIITSNTSSMPEIAGDAAEYIDPKSEFELSYKMDYLLGNKHRRNELSKAGMIREKMFSWEKASCETFHYYKNVLGV